MKKQLKIFHLVQLAHSALFKAADKKLKRELSVSTTQLAVLFSLSKQDNSPITAIADSLNMSYSSLSGVIDRMELAQLVRRKKSTTDARVQHVILQPKGRSIAQDSARKVRNINHALLNDFSVDEQHTIARFLTHVTHNAEQIVEGDE